MRHDVSVTRPMISTPFPLRGGRRRCAPSWCVRLCAATAAGCNSSAPPQNAAPPPRRRPRRRPRQAEWSAHLRLRRDRRQRRRHRHGCRAGHRQDPGRKRPRGIRLSKDGTQLMSRCPDRRSPGPAWTSRSCLRPIAPPTASASSTSPRASCSARISSGQDPEAFDVSPDGRSSLRLERGRRGDVGARPRPRRDRRKVKVGEEPEGVTVRPDGRVVYVSCEGDNEVVAVDTRVLKVVGAHQDGARPRVDGVHARRRDRVRRQRERRRRSTSSTRQKHTVTQTIKIPPTEGTPTVPRPMGTVMSPDGRQVYVSLGRAKSIAVIDRRQAGKLRPASRMSATRPWGIDVSADGRKLYTANGPSATCRSSTSTAARSRSGIRSAAAPGASPCGRGDGPHQRKHAV